MQYKDYAGYAEYQKEEKAYHGEVLDMYDVITFYGKTAKSVKKAFKDSVDDYEKFCMERPDMPLKVPIECQGMTYEEFEKKLRQDPQFVEEYEKLRPEFEKADKAIRERKKFKFNRVRSN